MIYRATKSLCLSRKVLTPSTNLSSSLCGVPRTSTIIPRLVIQKPSSNISNQKSSFKSSLSINSSARTISLTPSSAGRPASTLRGSALRLCDTSAFTQRIARSGGRAPIRQ